MLALVRCELGLLATVGFWLVALGSLCSAQGSAELFVAPAGLGLCISSKAYGISEYIRFGALVF